MSPLADSQAQPQTFNPVAIARQLQPLLAEYADECEQKRCVPAPVIEALRHAGLFRMMAPKRAGGPGCDLMTHVETVAALARGCVGAAWSFGILSGVTATLSGLGAEATKRIFEAGDELACSVSSLTGTAVAVDGGYLVSGTWNYGSGCLHASWALNGVRFLDSAGTVLDTGFALVPLRDAAVEIRDTWHVLGVAGSGSNTIVAQEVFIPSALALRSAERPSAQALLEMEGLEPRDRWPMEPLFPLGVLSPMLGAAEAMLDQVRASMEKRTVAGWTYRSQADSQVLTAQLGEAAMEIDSAWLHIRRSVAMLDVTAQVKELTGFEKARIQADCGYAMALLRRASERLMDVAGPSAFAVTHPLQRFWRDIQFGSRHHAMNTRLSLELYGRGLLGQPSILGLLPTIGATQ